MLIFNFSPSMRRSQFFMFSTAFIALYLMLTISKVVTWILHAQTKISTISIYFWNIYSWVDHIGAKARRYDMNRYKLANKQREKYIKKGTSNKELIKISCISIQT